MPVGDGPFPAPNADGLIFSPVTDAGASTTVTIPCGTWWLVVPEAPDLSIPLDVLSPTSSVMPGGMQGSPSHTITRERPQTVHEVLGDEFPVITKASEVKSPSMGLFVIFKGRPAFDAFQTIWEADYTCLVQSDLTDQWYVDLGATEKLDEVQSVDPSFTTLFVISLAIRAVDAPV